jgi:CRISPR-associated protein Cmr5
MSSVTELERDRAKEAYKYVTEANDNENIRDDYKSYVKKIPMMILNNGLGATFAFIYSKKKNSNAYEVIYNQIQEWLNADKDLVEWIINQDSQEYRATTNEVLALFNWLKRFADGMIEDKKDGKEKKEEK